jgi:hypothetical protein
LNRKEQAVAKRDPRVDAYIANAAEFARPILTHLRDVVHRNCPQVEETLKWRMPTFMHHGMLAGMAAFKQHCSFGFWKHELVVGKELASSPQGMGQFGKVTKVSDLPSARALAAYIKKAMELNEDGVKAPRAAPKKRAGRACRSGGGAEEEPQGLGDLRGVQSDQQTRLRRMDRRRQARRNAQQAAGAGDRMDGRG